MKAPYKLLFSNDTTNIEQCTSPYNNIRWLKKGPPKPFTPQMLEATVDETAGTGVDAHLLQPGVGWVPWWKSKIYPFSEHVRFLTERYGKKLSESGFAEYMAAGGDMVQVFVDRCKQKNLAPFISFRLNDSHGHEFTNAPPETIPGWAWHVFTPWHVNHPEWRIGNNLNDWQNRVLNWTVPEVREHKFGFIREIIEQYDIAGFELDFMRTNSFFRQNETTTAQRQKIMVDFVAGVRKLLDDTAKPGQHRWLCVRIPGRISRHDEIGVDVKAFHDAGVDMFNLCSSFFTEQQSDLAEIARMLPDAAVYNEGTYSSSLGAYLGGYDQACRRMTAEQFYTLGHLSYARGGAGVSTFNFVYYRQHHDNDKMGPWAEPPFHVFKGLADRAFCAAQPQHYFLPTSHGWSHVMGERITGNHHALDLDMVPPAGGWKRPGRMRIQAAGDLGSIRWEAQLNGKPLSPTADVSEPYPSPYPNCLGEPAFYRAWTIPADLVRDGINSIQYSCPAGEKPPQIMYVDLAMPA